MRSFIKNILRGFIFFAFLGNLFALHGKIVFYDGTYVLGKVVKVDESSVYIIPVGLDTPEGVLVGNIDSLNMENGMVPVLNSNVKYFYQGGTFTPNNDDWMASNIQKNYHEYINLEEEFQTLNDPKKHWNYFNFSLLGGIPLFVANSLKEVEPSPREGQMADMGPNIGLNIQFPYYPVGPVDISPGLRFMTFSYKADHLGALKALQIGTFTNIVCATFELSFNILSISKIINFLNNSILFSPTNLIIVLFSEISVTLVFSGFNCLINLLCVILNLSLLRKLISHSLGLSHIT